MPSQQEIYTKVAATLVEALNVDEEEITPMATLQGDLGAESIDSAPRSPWSVEVGLMSSSSTFNASTSVADTLV